MPIILLCPFRCDAHFVYCHVFSLVTEENVVVVGVVILLLLWVLVWSDAACVDTFAA